MLAVFAAQDMGHQRGANKALWNGSAWHLCLNNGLTTGSGQTRAAYLVHHVMARHILQLFHHILIIRLSGLLDLKFFKDQFQRQLLAAF